MKENNTAPMHQQAELDRFLRDFQLREANAALPRTVVAGLAVAALLIWVLSQGNDYQYVLEWIVALVVLSLSRIGCSSYFSSRLDSPLFKPALVLGALISGLIWGSSLFLLNPAETQPVIYFFVLFILAGLLGGAAFTNITYPPVYWSFSLVLVAACASWLWLYQPELYDVILTLFVFYFVGMSFFGVVSRENRFNAERLLRENERLLEDFSKSNQSLNQEIQRRSAYERKMEQSENRLRQLLELAPDAVLFTDGSGRIEFLNKAAEDLFGYCRDELLGQPVEKLMPERFARQHVDYRQRFVQDAGKRTITTNNEFIGRDKHGQEFPIEVNLSAVENNDSVGAIAIVRDVSGRHYVEKLQEETETRKRTEEELRRLLEEQSVFSSTVEDIMYKLDLEGHITWCNKKLAVVSGRDMDDIVGASVSSFLAEQDRSRALQVVQDVIQHGFAEVELEMITAKGPALYHFNGAALKDAQGGVIGLVGIGRDISDWKKTQELIEQSRQRLLESEQRFAISQRFANIGTFEWNIQTNESVWSDNIWTLLGLDKTTEASFKNYLQQVLPADRAHLSQAMKNSVEYGEDVDVQYRVAWPDGSVHWIRGRGNVERNDNGEPMRMLGVIIDIDSIKEAEHQSRNLMQQLQQAQKMESIGQLTGGIAHDFNNILASVMGYSDLIRNAPEDMSREKINKYIDNVLMAAGRARDMIKQLLAFSRGEEGKLRPLCVNSLIDEVTAMLRPALPSSITIVEKLADELPPIMGDAVQLGQMIMNLGINARDAMDGRGEIHISVERQQVSNLVCDSCFHTFEGDFVVIRVCDQGPGIEPSIFGRIFEPFVSSKDVGKGTGMGLAMVHGVVHNHQGHVKVDSPPGEGACFYIYLPVAEAQQLPDSDHTTVFDMEEQQASIMVVDDEALLGVLYQEILSQCGYQVEVFEHPRQALDAFNRQPDAYDVVLTDYTMPDLTGIELSQKLLAIRPELPIVLCTGYSENVNAEMALQAGVKVFLMKPVDHDKLLDSIHAILKDAPVS